MAKVLGNWLQERGVKVAQQEHQKVSSLAQLCREFANCVVLKQGQLDRDVSPTQRSQGLSVVNETK